MIGPIRLSDEAKAGKCRERVGSPDGSHLSPDGGSLSRAAVHRLAADGYDSAADDAPSQDVATCRQTAEAYLAPPSTAWQRMATIRQQTMQVPKT